MRVRSGLTAAILLATHCASAADLSKLVPVQWPGGPVEVARRRAVKPISAELAVALQDWYQPWSLDLLRDTPVNCILLTWSAGTAHRSLEREQQRLVRQYASEAHQRGIRVLAIIPAGDAPARHVANAVDAGLDGLVVEDEATGDRQPAKGFELPVITLSAKAATAPGVRMFSEDGAVQATPTSEPWIDSNLWLVRSLRAWAPDTAWLGYKLEAASDRDYVRAIADAAAAGGRWVVTLDDRLTAGLATRKPEAGSCWRRIVTTLQFFEEHAGWRQFMPTGPLGIVESHTDMAQENLNLIARRKIPYRLLDRAALSNSGLAGLRAVVAIGFVLTAAERLTLRRFAEDGGLAIVGPGWGESIPKTGDFEVRPMGKGRFAIYRETEPDPEALSKDVLHLMGKDNLGIRLFHAVTVLPSVSESRDGRQLLIGMMNYASEPAEAVMVRMAGEYRSARLYGFDTGPVELEMEKSGRGTEVKVPSVPVYAALVMEK